MHLVTHRLYVINILTINVYIIICKVDNRLAECSTEDHIYMFKAYLNVNQFPAQLKLSGSKFLS